MQNDYYTKYAPEKGIYYYSDSDEIIFWEGFFDELFTIISELLDYNDYPIEFKEYNDVTGWVEDDSTKIDVVKTLKCINFININDIKSSKEFILDLKIFLENNITSDIKIETYF